MNRNRIPTVFGIYMLDVICCALGCVILLWQVKHIEWEQETEHARKAEMEAKLTLEKWKANNTELISATAEIDSLRHALQEGAKREARLTVEKAQTERGRDDAIRIVALREKDLDKVRA